MSTQIDKQDIQTDLQPNVQSNVQSNIQSNVQVPPIKITASLLLVYYMSGMLIGIILGMLILTLVRPLIAQDQLVYFLFAPVGLGSLIGFRMIYLANEHALTMGESIKATFGFKVTTLIFSLLSCSALFHPENVYAQDIAKVHGIIGSVTKSPSQTLHVDDLLVKQDEINTDEGAFAFLLLHNGYLVKIDEALSLKLEDLVLIDAPKTNTSIKKQLDSLLSAQDRKVIQLSSFEVFALSNSDEMPKRDEIGSAPPPPPAPAPAPEPAPASSSAPGSIPTRGAISVPSGGGGGISKESAPEESAKSAAPIVASEAKAEAEMDGMSEGGISERKSPARSASSASSASSEASAERRREAPKKKSKTSQSMLTDQEKPALSEPDLSKLKSCIISQIPRFNQNEKKTKTIQIILKSKDQLVTIDRIFLGNGLNTPTCLAKFQTKIASTLNPHQATHRPNFYQYLINIDLN